MKDHRGDVTSVCSAARAHTLLSFSENKMTLAELKSLVETMNNLPCVMNKMEEMQVRRTLCHNHKETI